MNTDIDSAPTAIDEAVINRQVSIELLIASTPISEEALSELMERRTVHLPPHPKVTLDSPVNWYMDPLGQRNWCAQLHMFRWLRPLIHHMKRNKDTAVASELVRYVRTWAESAFPQKDAPVFAWADMIDAVRALELLDVYIVVPEIEKSFVADLLYAHGEWMRNPANLGHSNHAVWQHTALFVLGQVFHEQDWIDVSKQRLLQEFENGYDADGINQEAAPDYHLYNYILWQDVNRRMAAEGDAIPELEIKLEKARKALVQFTWPDGSLIELGDTKPNSHLKKLSGDGGVDYVLTKGADGNIPEQTFTVFNAGYVLARSGWGANAKDYEDEFFWGLRFGAIGVHGHNDLGSLLLGASGKRLFIDGGKYGYISDKNRRHVISRAAHNTLVVTDEKEKDDVQYEVLHQNHSGTIDDIAIQGRPYQGVRHTRRVIYVRGADAVIIFDNAASRKEHEYHLYWHLNPKAKITRSSTKHQVSIDGANFAVVSLGKAPFTKVVRAESGPTMEGWYSPKWGEIAGTPTIKMSKSGERLRFITIIAADDKMKFEAESLGAGSNQFVLTTGHGYYAVDASTVPATVTFSRKAKPAQIVPASLNLQELSDLSAELEAKEISFESSIGRRIKGRLETIVGTQDSVGEGVLAGIQEARHCGAKDHGLRAAIIDTISFALGENHSLVSKLKESDSMFRSPLDFQGFGEREKATGIFESEADEDNVFNGAAIEGSHLLSWAGRKRSKTLVVRFNGAIDRSRISVPYYGGFTSLLPRDESVLVFSDPAFDSNSDLTLGWYLGELPDGSLIYDWINRVIDYYVAEWEIQEVILFGTSGGGYASLQVGLRRDNTKIVPMNPQTVLSNYFKTFYSRARDSAFRDGELAEMRHAGAFDARQLLIDCPKGNSIHYVDNSVGDTHHHQLHFQPFNEAAKAQGVKLEHIEVDLGKGHKSVGAELVNQYLDRVVNADS